MLIHEIRLRVRYAETDQMGVVHHANYLVWMEMGRVEYCRSRGLLYKDMEEQGSVRLAVVDAQCRYVHPARFDEEVQVSTWVAAAAPRMVRFAYELRDAETSKLLASGETRHIFCDARMRAIKLPERYRGIFGIGGGPERSEG